MKLTSEHRGGALRRSGVSADFAHVPPSVVRRVKQRTADNERSCLAHRTSCSPGAAARPFVPWAGRRCSPYGADPRCDCDVCRRRAVVDHHLIRTAGFRHARVPSQPEPQNALHAVRFVTDNVAGYWAARWYLKEKHVSAVVGLGGASSAATVRAAISRGSRWCCWSKMSFRAASPAGWLVRCHGVCWLRRDAILFSFCGAADGHGQSGTAGV